MKRQLLAAIAFSAIVVASNSAGADAWKEFKSDKYGFKMQIPEKMNLVAAQAPNKEWGGLYAKLGVVELWGIAHLGTKHKPKAIELFGIGLTKIPGKLWRPLKSGQNRQGFEWYKSAVATHQGKALVALYGVGPKGSYLLFLKTTKANYAMNAKAYHRWAKSIQLY